MIIARMNSSILEMTTAIETMFSEFETTLSSIHREELLEMPAPDFDVFDEHEEAQPQNRVKDTSVVVDLVESLSSVHRILEGKDDFTIQPVIFSFNRDFLPCHDGLKNPLKKLSPPPVGGHDPATTALEIISELVDDLDGFSSHSTESLFPTASAPVVLHGKQEAFNGMHVDNTLKIPLSQVFRDGLEDSFVSDTDIFEDDIHQSPLKNKRIAAEVTPAPAHHHQQFPAHPCKKQRCETTEEQSLSDRSPFMEKVSERRFRSYQEEQWYIKFDELVAYKRMHGHCQVPHGYVLNPTLARWTKRQRYQFKLKQEAKPSTMTEGRIAALEKLGFVWDSHTAQWFERLDEVREYKVNHGDCNVPSVYPPNPKMAIWVKCQRRQCKLLKSRKSSNMTQERIALLDQIEFIWEVRKACQF
jgi:hypothetical protein